MGRVHVCKHVHYDKSVAPLHVAAPDDMETYSGMEYVVSEGL